MQQELETTKTELAFTKSRMVQMNDQHTIQTNKSFVENKKLRSEKKMVLDELNETKKIYENSLLKKKKENLQEKNEKRFQFEITTLNNCIQKIKIEQKKLLQENHHLKESLTKDRVQVGKFKKKY